MSADVALILAAAGAGTRMKDPVRKPFLDLCGRPLLFVTLERFAPFGRICQVIVTVNAEDYRCKDALLLERVSPQITDVVVGGATRTESVANALAVLDDRAEIVLVHDAVRPFVKPEVISAVIEAAARHGAAIAAAPVKDTIKRVENGLIAATLPRDALYLAQTPQGFERSVIERAYRARGAGDFTDDALLVEKSGLPVAVVESTHDNFKITTPEDLALARAILQGRR